MKETINLTEHVTLDEGYHVECYASSIVKGPAEAKEALASAMKKRTPDVRRA